MANKLDYDVVVINFKLQSQFYVPFWTYILRKCVKYTISLTAMGQIVTLLFFLNDDLSI